MRSIGFSSDRGRVGAKASSWRVDGVPGSRWPSARRWKGPEPDAFECFPRTPSPTNFLLRSL